MAIPASISLLDAAAVAHVFTPIQDGPEAKFVNGTGATILSTQEVLTVEVNRAKTDNAQSTGRVVVLDPKEGTVDGKTQVLYSNSGSAVLKFAPNASESEKKDTMRMLAQALINTDVVDAICNGKPFT